MHEVLVNRLGGLSLPRKSVVRLTGRPDMTLDVYRGRKTTIQQQQLHCFSQILTELLLLYISASQRCCISTQLYTVWLSHESTAVLPCCGQRCPSLAVFLHSLQLSKRTLWQHQRNPTLVIVSLVLCRCSRKKWNSSCDYCHNVTKVRN